MRAGHVGSLRTARPLGWRVAVANRLRELHETANRGEDADAIAIIVAVVAMFVLTIVAVVVSADLVIYYAVK